MNAFEESYRENISALLDGELSETEARALLACVETSDEPRAIFQAFSALEGALPDAFPEAPDTLHEHILSGVRRAASQQTSRSPRQEAEPPRRNRRRQASLRRYRTAAIAAACLVVVITGAALSGRFLRMGRSDAGSGASADTATMSLPGAGIKIADVPADASGREDGVAMDTTAAEEEADLEAPAPGDDTAHDTSGAENAALRLEGLTSFMVFTDSETYEGAYAVEAVDEFFKSGPSDKVLNLSVAFPEGDAYNVQLWYRGGKAVCSVNEDGLEVRSLEDILAYFRAG